MIWILWCRKVPNFSSGKKNPGNATKPRVERSLQGPGAACRPGRICSLALRPASLCSARPAGTPGLWSPKTLCSCVWTPPPQSADTYTSGSHIRCAFQNNTTLLLAFFHSGTEIQWHNESHNEWLL